MIYIVMHYEDESNEICYVASTLESAKDFVAAQRSKICTHEYYDENWMIESRQCRIVREADDLDIQGWDLDSSSPAVTDL